jgi:predicted Zn-dependent protease
VARYGSAVKSIKAGKPDQAVAPLEELVKLDPDAYLAQAMLGELLLQLQNPQGSVKPLEDALRIVPDAYDVQHNLALAYLGAGRPRDALTLIGKSLAVQKSDTWRSLFVRGAAEAETANYSQASADFRRVIEAKPDFIEARQALAQCEPPAALSAPPQVEIPYAKLVIRSEYWPLYP